MTSKEEKIKVTKRIELNEVIECDGSFFYISKQKLNSIWKKEFNRYFLKTVIKKDKILIASKLLDKLETKKESK